MPRLPPSLLHLACNESPLLPPLLRECRDLPSSRNELRWLTEHAIETSRSRILASPTSTSKTSHHPRSGKPASGWRSLLQGYVERREKGEPLQYILGNQPFGELELLCRRGVLIPRWETEVYTSMIGSLAVELLTENDELRAKHGRRPLRVLDLCTGTGCIPLCLYEMLSDKMGRRQEIEVFGVDISTRALALASENLRHNIMRGYLPDTTAEDITFLRADVLPSFSRMSCTGSTAPPYILDALEAPLGKGKDKPEIDILTANPPYISPIHFSSGRTSRSVRRYEPRLALVPASSSSGMPLLADRPPVTPTPGDDFYHHILPLCRRLNAGLTVLEVGDTEQAGRVIELARMVFTRAGERKDDEVESTEQTDAEVLMEMWFDDGRTEAWRPKESGYSGSTQKEKEKETEEVSARTVVIWRREWAVWRKRQQRSSGQREKRPRM